MQFQAIQYEVNHDKQIKKIILVAHNGKRFDVPFLMASLERYKISHLWLECTIPRIGITCRSRNETSSKKIVQSDGRSTIKKLYSWPDGPIIIIQSNT